MSHTVESCSKNAPNAACNKALLLNPFFGKKDCLAIGGNYQCCRVADRSQFAGSELIELKTSFTVSCNGSGDIAFQVVPDPHSCVRAMNGAITFGNGTLINSASTEIPMPAFMSSILGSTQAYRVVSMGINVQANQQVMNQAGTIVAANFPADPYYSLINNTNFTSTAFVENQPGALLCKTVQGGNVPWIPSSNTVAFANTSVATDPAVNVNNIVRWTYEDWTFPLVTGSPYPLDVFTTLPRGQLYGSGSFTVHADAMAPVIIVAGSGFATMPSVVGLTCELIMHLEIIPRDVGRAVSAGSVGIIVGAELGAPSSAVVSGNRQQSFIEFAAHYGPQALRVMKSIGSTAWGLAKTYGPTAMAVGSAFL